MFTLKRLFSSTSVLLLVALTLSMVVGVLTSNPASAVGTITVNSTADNSTMDATCTLREAIIAARSDGDFNGCSGGTGSGDTIAFSVAGRITLDNSLGQLPEILDDTVIDGSSAPGFILGGNPVVIIDGVNLSVAPDGITIADGAGTIRSLSIVNFAGSGILINSAGTTGSQVIGSQIGTADGGTTAEPNFIGIQISNGGLNSTILIGLTGSPTNGNLIAGNTSAGIVINNTSGASVSNNTITGNGAMGITIAGNSADLVIGGSPGGTNTITDNGGDGIVHEGTGVNNNFLYNEINDNGGIGIDLGTTGVTVNDANDVDAGSNDLINFPVLTNADWDGGTLTVDGTVDLPNGVTNYTLQFFLNATCDISGNGEGETIPGSSTLNRVTDTSGDDIFTHTMSTADVVGQQVTAVLHVIGSGTSEFSACQEIVSGGSTATATPDPGITPTPTPDPSVTELLVNGGFEDDTNGDNLPDGWSGKRTDLRRSDKLKCNKTDRPNGKPDKIFARTGDCAFMFRGNPERRTTKIEQTLASTAAITDGSTLTFSAYVDPRSAAPGTRIALAKVKYSDGNKDKLRLSIPAADGYALTADSVVVNLTGRTIEKVKVDFRYRGTSGRFFIDDASLSVSTGGSPIPLPAAPGFRD